MDFKKAYNKASALCARREYCSGDIFKKLNNWEVDKPIANKVVAQLIEEKFIDDLRFAKFYVNDKSKFNRWGKDKIVWQLRMKKVDQEIINEAIANLNDDEMLETLSALLREKNRLIKEPDFQKRKASLIRFGAGRGFSYDQIRKVLDEILKDN